MEDQMTANQALFTDSFSKLTRWVSRIEVSAPVDEKASKIRVPEKTIRCIWNDQLFKTDSLRTTDDSKLEIIFQGYWNFGPGPDFKSAVINVDGKTLEGDVEIHVHSSDREAETHFTDPEYGNVILHVFLWKSAFGNGHPTKNRDASTGIKKVIWTGAFSISTTNWISTVIPNKINRTTVDATHRWPGFPKRN